ncbi:MAG TPA: hypothetical protein O0X97_00795 [Methanocorpusculum sp.]|nr:hypothetical protein [Methanocorpusculum sp.]
MGFLDGLKSTARTELDAAKKAVRSGQLKAELNDLKRLEQDAFATLGRAAADAYGLEAFGEHGRRVTEIRERIAVKEAEIKEAETIIL